MKEAFHFATSAALVDCSTWSCYPNSHSGKTTTAWLYWFHLQIIDGTDFNPAVAHNVAGVVSGETLLQLCRRVGAPCGIALLLWSEGAFHPVRLFL